MGQREGNRYPIQLLVNYWETRPSLIGEHLDQLIRRGVKEVSSFVPWQAVESDISHALPRFLQAACERKMSVSLILTPEVGVHYPNSGLPRDLAAKSDLHSKNENGSKPLCILPPNSFSLPSFFSQDFSKRYYSFLNRLDSMFADLARATPGFSESIRIWVSGSLWKYYRSPRSISVGDFSNFASLAYRQQLESFFMQKEFSENGGSARWQAKELDSIHRRWFQQQSEDVFRSRSFHQLRKKSRDVTADEIELFTPEADSSLQYARVAGSLGAKTSVFQKLSSLIDDYAVRTSASQNDPSQKNLKAIHWTAMGDFAASFGPESALSESERQFLMLKSLLLFGAQGGALLIDEKEWFSFKDTFRARLENYARFIANGDLARKPRCAYFTSHLWSKAGAFFDEISAELSSEIHLATSLDWIIAQPEIRLIAIDPQQILTRESLLKLSTWAKKGGVVVFSQDSLFTEGAKVDLQKILAVSKRIEVNLGVPHRLYGVGDARWVIYNESGASAEARKQFAGALISVAEIQPVCRMESPNVSFVSLEKKSGGHGVFILNPTKQKTSAEILFGSCKMVADLSQSLSNPDRADAVEAEHLTLEIPSNGVLPLSVSFPEVISETRLVVETTKSQESGASIWN